MNIYVLLGYVEFLWHIFGNLKYQVLLKLWGKKKKESYKNHPN